MRFYILSDMFSLESWLIDGAEPRSMPAVYEFFEYLGRSPAHVFTATIISKKHNRRITFENGSQIQIRRLYIPGHYVWKFVAFFYQAYLAYRAVRSESHDVVYGMTIYAVIASWIGKRRGVASVSRLFGSLIYDAMRKGQFGKLYTRFFFQYLEARFPGDLVFCTEDGTEFDKALQRIRPDKKAYMLYNGMNPNLKASLTAIPIVSRIRRDQTIHLISIGRLTAWKRHDLAIRLLHKLRHTHGIENAQLTILGRGEAGPSLQRLVRKLKLESFVHFQGVVPHEELPSVLKAHAIALFLYDASNLGNSTWEASLAGRLICTRPTGKTAAVYEDGVQAVIEDDMDEMARRIVTLLDTDISHLTNGARSLVNGLLPTWEERLQTEMETIQMAVDQQALAADDKYVP